MSAVSLKVLGAALVVAALLGGVAKAAEVPNHPFLPKRFNEQPTITGGDTPAGNFEDACGVAVDSEGDIYVSDYYHHAVNVFGREGEYLTQIANVGPLDGPCGLAVDSAGAVYVNAWHRDVVKYVPDAYPFSPSEGANYDAGTVIDSAHPTGVAVDPAGDNLYVNARTYVAVYRPSGAPVLEAGEPLRIGLGSLTDAFGVAVSAFPTTAGQVYVADAGDDTVKVFDPAVDLIDPVAVIDGAGTPRDGFVSLFDSSLALDQSNGHLFVADNTEPGFEHPAAAVYEFGPTGLYRDQLAHAFVHGEPVGIAVDESTGKDHGDVYVTTGNGTNDVFPKVPNSEESVLYAFGPAGASKTLSVALAGAGVGTVLSQPAGISCPGSCEAEFSSGKALTLTATPGLGSAFVGWSGPCSGTGSCQISLSGNVTLSAEFAAAPELAGAGAAMRVGPEAAAAPVALGSTAAAKRRRASARHHRARARAKHRRPRAKGQGR